MAKGTSSHNCCCCCCFLFFLLHLVLFLGNSVKGSDVPNVKGSRSNEFETREVDREKEELFPSIHRALMEYFHYKLTEFDSIDPPTTALPSAPVMNPVTAPAVTTPPVNSAPGIVTVPGTNPTNTPVTNPVTTPSTNPTQSPPSGVSTNPTQSPPTTSGGGGRWCIVKNGASQAAVQSGLDYACGIGGADCSTIQQGASCYDPPTLQNHASYAFNSYYQKNPLPTSCDFGGAAVVTTNNPSTGSCVYPSSSSSSSSSPSSTTPTSPITQAPVNPTSLPTPTTSSSSPGSTGTQSPPPGFSFGNPDPTGLGAFGASPPLMNTASVSNNLRPFIGSLVIVTSIITSRLM